MTPELTRDDARLRTLLRAAEIRAKVLYLSQIEFARALEALSLASARYHPLTPHEITDHAHDR